MAESGQKGAVEFVDDSKLIVEIPESVPYTNGRYPTEDLIEFFLVDEDAASKYQEAKEWYYWVAGKPFPILLFGYLLSLIFLYSTQQWSLLSEQYRSTITALLFGLSLIGATAGWIMKRIFRNRAMNQGISHEEFIYWRLAKSISEFRDGNTERAMEDLTSVDNFLNRDDEKAFDGNFSKELDEYISEVENNGPEFFTETFPEIADRTLRYLVSIRHNDLKTIYRDKPEKTAQESYGPLNMVQSYISDWTNNRFAKIVTPYIPVAPLIALVYLYIGETVAQILAVVAVGIIQKYHDPDLGES